MSTASDRLQLYLDAEKAILQGGQSARVNNPMIGKEVTWADLSEIRQTIQELQRQVRTESGRNEGPRFSVARFGDPRC